MRLSPWRITIIAIIVAAVLIGTGWLALRPSGPLLAEASFGLDTISPNADGIDDITQIDYTLNRPANVSIYFLDDDDNRYDFRVERPRQSGDHSDLSSDDLGAAARHLEGAVDAVLSRPANHTPDLGGSATTGQFADAVARAITEQESV